MAKAPAESIAAIREQSARIRALLASDELTASVPRSAWTVAEHLDHTIKVATSTVAVLLKPSLPVLARGMNLMGRLVLFLGWIPRGRGSAPEKLRGTRATRAQLETELDALDAVLDRAAAEPPRDASPVLRHPAFGGLSFAEALAFVVVHTNHHLKIVASR